jgi:hypothetical protein
MGLLQHWIMNPEAYDDHQYIGYMVTKVLPNGVY